MKFFTSDTHFGHMNIIKYCGRPFSSVEEMDETIIERWNTVVGAGDEVYHLGDFSFRQRPDDLQHIFRRLNGQIHLIHGNHDHKALRKYKGFASVEQLKHVKIGDTPTALCHYPMRSWNKSCHGSWHLYGHVHGLSEPWGLSFDVGVDVWDFTPVSEEQVAAKMEELDGKSRGTDQPSRLL